MTNILVPTDFSLSSIRDAEAAINLCESTPCNIILFHAFALPQTPVELLYGESNLLPNKLLTDNFRQGCRQLKDQYRRKLAKIVVRPMHGNSRALFRNYLDANEINMIYYPENYVFRPAHQTSLDPKYFFQQAGVPVLRIAANNPRVLLTPDHSLALQS